MLLPGSMVNFWDPQEPVNKKAHAEKCIAVGNVIKLLKSHEIRVNRGRKSLFLLFLACVKLPNNL